MLSHMNFNTKHIRNFRYVKDYNFFYIPFIPFIFMRLHNTYSEVHKAPAVQLFFYQFLFYIFFLLRLLFHENLSFEVENFGEGKFLG